MKRVHKLVFFCLACLGLAAFQAGIVLAESAKFSRDIQVPAPILIKDINPGAGSSILYQLSWVKLIAMGNTIYFSAQDNSGAGIELWKSDGSAAGTVMVKDIHPNDNSDPANFAILNDVLFFAADDGLYGKELWKSDGSADGTQIVKDIYPGIGSAHPGTLTACGDQVYFTANDSLHAYELWKSDGTVTGTVLVKEITPGGALTWPYQYQVGLTDLNGTLLFASYGGSSQYDWDLWRSDGSPTGTVMVKDFYGSMLGNQTVMGNAMYFTVFQGSYGTELWKSDGTTGGTALVKNINPTHNSSSDPANLVVISDTLYFSANDGVHGAELWKSDGSSDGTVMVQDIHPSGGSFAAGCGTPPCAANVNGVLYFAADDGTNGLELWKSDGTSDGTVLVKDLRLNGSGNPGLFTPAKGKLFFVVPNDIGNGLWISDGTAAGTLMIKNFTGAAPARLTVAGDWLLFAADDESNIGKELWGVYLGELQHVFLPVINR